MACLKLRGSPYPPQIRFFKSKKRRIAYGGARGGGKSWALRRKFVLLCLNKPGIQILLIRRTLKDLRKNHELPLMAELEGVARYDKQNKEFHFPNGAMLCLGYCDSESDVLQYQGQAYDVIGMEEATQFTEFQFQCLTESNRRSITMQGNFVSRMYFTCNPGGVGHAWVKRLFIDRQYVGDEDAADYDFIPAKVYDNDYIMQNDPAYVKTLESLPEDRRRAMLDGDWDVFEGQYFREWNRDIHVVAPFAIPENWRLFRSIDYGLDMLACYWWAVNESGRVFAYRELYEPDLTLSMAAKKILELTPDDEVERIEYTAGPPDLFSRRQETGKSGAELMADAGLDDLLKADNNRETGWLNLKEYLAQCTTETGEPGAYLQVFDGCCPNLVRCLPQLQHDPKKPNDVAKDPHELTHGPDSVRYFVRTRPLAAKPIEKKKGTVQKHKEQLAKKASMMQKRRRYA